MWSKLSGADRGKYLFRIARLVQERSRELAVAESLDNGKPIKESRDVDVPLVAAWFFYYAGWADKLDHAGLGANPRSLGVAAQVIPWNFPLLMLAWKIAPALAAGNTVVLKPAETTPLSALIFAEILQQADLPPGVVNIITGAGDTGQALVQHPDVNKVAFTGSTAVGRAIAKSIAGTDKKLTLELGGKAANIVFDDAPIDQAIEGIVNGIFFNQGHVCCAGSRLLVQENVHDDVIERLKTRLGTLRMGDPLDKNTDIGAINSKEQLDRIRELSDIGEAGGRRALERALRDPGQGLLVRTDDLHQRVDQPPHRPRGDLRTGALGADVPHARRGDREGEQHAVRAVCRHLDRQGIEDPRRRQPAACRGGVGEHVQPLRPVQPVRRLQGVRLRPRGRPPGAGRVPGGCDARPSGLDEGRRQVSRLAVPKTYKLLIGGKFPRSESGRTYEVLSAKGAFLANAAKASRKDARDAVVAARAAFAGWSSATAYNRGQVLYRIAELLEGRRAQFVDELRASEGLSAAAADTQVSAAIDTWVWYAGWADKYLQVAGNANPVAGPFFNLSVPEPTGVVAIVAPQDKASLLGLVSVVAPAILSGNTVVVIANEQAPLSAISLGEVLATSDVPGGVVNILTGSPAEIAPWLAGPRGRQRPRPRRRRRDRLGRAAGDRRRHIEAGAAPRARDRRHLRCSASSHSSRSRRSGTPRPSSEPGNETVTAVLR